MASLSEHLEAAAYVLAGSEPLKERLFIAWSKHLAELEARDFPRDVRDEFEELIAALHRERALPGDTVLRASLRKLSTVEASRYAKLIIRTYARVAALKSSQPQVLPRIPTAQIASIFASEAAR
jgi:hypothetical protein